MLDTGKFSRMARVSKRTLRYYDSIDLFKPTHVDPDKGIRYYSAKQMADLNRILALKELGMSLDQIRRMLEEDVSQEEIHGMLMLKRAEAEQALLASVQRFRSIEARIQNPDLFLKQGIVLKAVEKLPFSSCRRVVTDYTEFQAMGFSILKQVPQLVAKGNFSQFASLIHGDTFDFEDGNLDVEMGILMPRLTGQSIEISEDFFLEERILPAVKAMASVVVSGGPSRYPAGFAAAAQWIEDNGYEIVGPQREILLEIPASGDQNDMVIELQFPVEQSALSVDKFILDSQ